MARVVDHSMPEIQRGDDVIEKDQEEGRNERNAAKPREHEIAVAGAGRRRLNPNYVMKSSE
jgi:hypothetical protein